MRIDDFDKFLTEIGNYDLLSKEEQQQLIRAVQEKGPDCDEAERLVKCNLRFVVGLANQYQKLGLSPAELITIGVEELRKAAMTYNLSIDIPFIRHAVPLMRQSMVEQTLPKRAIVYVDMDNVLVDFMSGIRKCAAEEVENYGKTNDLDDIPGVFSKMEPIEGAIDAFRFLAERFDTYILSTAPWDNPSAWSDKLVWVKRYLGDFAYKRLILSHHKDLNLGDYLIDDSTNNGVSWFQGKHIHFGSPEFSDWASVLRYFTDVVRKKT